MTTTVYTLKWNIKCMSICIQTFGKMTLLIVLYLHYNLIPQKNITSVVVFIMNWQLKPPIKQEFFF